MNFEKWVANRWGASAPLDRQWIIASMGLGGETGEVLEHLKKHFRDHKYPGNDLKLEMGDVLHYLTFLGQCYGWTLEEIMAANITKLEERDRVKRESSRSV